MKVDERDPREVPLLERLSPEQERVRFTSGRPSDDLLFKLGRVVYDALHLQAGVYLVARFVLQKDVSDQPASTALKAVRRAAASWVDSDLKEEVLTWCTECLAALEERNAVLHGFFVSTAEEPALCDTDIAFRPRGGGM